MITTAENFGIGSIASRQPTFKVELGKDAQNTEVFVGFREFQKHLTGKPPEGMTKHVSFETPKTDNPKRNELDLKGLGMTKMNSNPS